MCTSSPLPPRLLQAISSRDSGVVLVLGAGCSYETPTSLPLSDDLSEQCHRQLVADGVLNDGEVSNPRDLTAVAEAVFQKTSSQRELIQRFPPNAFRNAEPNEGYRIMAALLREGALTDTMTLNFDWAARVALANLGAGQEVSTINGPEMFDQLGDRNLIYLHRDIDSPPDEIILRTKQLDEAWQGNWQQVIAQKVLAVPVIVFVGLGSPASVLVETTKRIQKALGSGQASVYVVDPAEYEDSAFASALQIPAEDYLQMGWRDFMRALSQRLVEEHRAEIKGVCDTLNAQLAIEPEDVAEVCDRLAELGLLELGKLRAKWMLEERTYMSFQQGNDLRLFGTLVLAVRMIERVSGRQAQFRTDGLVEFCIDGHIKRVVICSGCGWMDVALVQKRLSWWLEDLPPQDSPPAVALVGSVRPGPVPETPIDIVVETDPNDVIAGDRSIPILSIEELWAKPELVTEVIR